MLCFETIWVCASYLSWVESFWSVACVLSSVLHLQRISKYLLCEHVIKATLRGDGTQNGLEHLVLARRMDWSIRDKNREQNVNGAAFIEKRPCARWSGDTGTWGRAVMKFQISTLGCLYEEESQVLIITCSCSKGTCDFQRYSYIFSSFMKCV